MKFDKLIEIYNTLGIFDFIFIFFMFMVGTLFLQLIKDWKKVYDILTKPMKKKKEKKELENQKREIELEEKKEHNIKAKRITGKSKEDRKRAYYIMRNNINLISYLKRWNNRFHYDETYSFFSETKFNDDQIQKRKWNGRIWSHHKSKVFIEAFETLFDQFYKDYVEFESDDEYYKYFRLSFWEDFIHQNVAEYKNRATDYGMNPIFSDKLNFRHDEQVNNLIEEIRSIIQKNTYNNITDIIEDISIKFNNGFVSAFEHLKDILCLNSDLEVELKTWEIPSKRDITHKDDYKVKSLTASEDKDYVIRIDCE